MGRTAKRFKRKDDGWPLAKSLTGIPTLYAWSLAYGRNLLTGDESPAGMWRIRNLVAWVRPNPPVGALGDKFRPATSYITVATIATNRWFDLEAVRSEVRPENHRETTARNGRKAQAADDRQAVRFTQRTAMSGAPPLDWWEITPGGYSGTHYAVFPPELPKRLVASMCPRRVCRSCGEPSRRITTRQRIAPNGTIVTGDFNNRRKRDGHDGMGLDSGAGADGTTTTTTTVGWSDCGHDDWRPGLVLDPFAGSGTTLAVASGMGRDSIGIDLDDRNADLALERVGMFLDITAGLTAPAGKKAPTP